MRTLCSKAPSIAAVAAIALLAACGVPTQAKPVPIARSAVPFSLLAPSTPSATVPPAPVEVPVQVYLVAPDGHLAPVTRDVAFPAPLSAVLVALLAGPTNPEASSGLESAIPSGARILSVSEAAGTATIDLGNAFGQLVGQTQIEAIAQIVFSATSVPGVHAVKFDLAGTPIEVPVANGAETPGPLTRAQYAGLAP
ncbi:MAG: GerMN domain-containing protein [Acidimicrobiales bacterium]|jgi:spore germination protein GerM|nr:GerMN domain-containing protein [Actinomycetota bacterium]MDA8185755.1 GerMN domain-containing protein [Actinomycetota bacterium]